MEIYMPEKGKLTGKYIKCENCGKMIYRTPYRLQKNIHQFCCTACQKEFEHKERYEDRSCEICGKLMHISKKSTQRFCSDECQHEWQKLRVGDLNQKTKRVDTTCEWCGAVFKRIPSAIDRVDHSFCCDDCRINWYANVFSQQEDWKEESRKRAVKILQNELIQNVNTKPQVIINNLLNNIGIKYRNEESYKYYSIDNFLLDYNLAIEVMGDFWHASPIKYTPEKLYPNQRKTIGRDKAKRTYIKKYYNVEILYLWEDDIYNRLDVCKKLIIGFIENNGILQNYNSFNYSINNGELILNETIIIPYQEQQVVA